LMREYHCSSLMVMTQTWNGFWGILMANHNPHSRPFEMKHRSIWMNTQLRSTIMQTRGVLVLTFCYISRGLVWRSGKVA
jgi:hypothetical protein